MAKYSLGDILTSPQGNQYEINRYLGEGVTAQVYLAQRLMVIDVNDRFPQGSKVALKVMQDGLPEDIAQSFHDEATTMGLLAYHLGKEDAGLIPAVVETVMGRDVGQEFIALEFVTGEPVDELVESSGTMAEADVLILADQVLRVLQALHEGEHRSYTDFQLQNIWWQAETQMIKVMDWNHVSRQAVDGETPAGAVDDLIRLGSYLYQLATGKGARQTGETAHALEKRAGEQWQSLSAALRSILQQALHPNPQKRFQTAAAFRQAIKKVVRLWQTDVEDLDLDVLTAMRPIQSIKAKGASANPALLQEAVVLVDMLRRRQPDTPRVDEYWQQLQELQEGISDTWFSGRQNYQAGYFSKAEEIWEQEAQAVDRVDLWRWVQAARLANAVGPTQYREAYQVAVEAAIEAMNEEKWGEAAEHLENQTDRVIVLQRLQQEVKAHQIWQQAARLESEGKWDDAQAEYQQIMTLLEDVPYRSCLEEETGWSKEFLAGKVAYCQVQTKKTKEAEKILTDLEKDFDKSLIVLKEKLVESPSNKMIQAAIAQAAERWQDPSQTIQLWQTLVDWSDLPADSNERHKLRNARKRELEAKLEKALGRRDWESAQLHLKEITPPVSADIQESLGQTFEQAIVGGWLSLAETVSSAVSLFADENSLQQMAAKIQGLRDKVDQRPSSVVEMHLREVDNLLDKAGSVAGDWNLAETRLEQVAAILDSLDASDGRKEDLQRRHSALQTKVREEKQVAAVQQALQEARKLLDVDTTIGKAAKHLTDASNQLADMAEGDKKLALSSDLRELEKLLKKKGSSPEAGLSSGSAGLSSGSSELLVRAINRVENQQRNQVLIAILMIAGLLVVLALIAFSWREGRQKISAVATRGAETGNAVAQVQQQVTENNQEIAAIQETFDEGIGGLNKQIRANSAAVETRFDGLPAELFPSPTPTITPSPTPSPTTMPPPQPWDLSVAYVSPPLPVQETNVFFDLPDMQLQLPANWRFDLTNLEVMVQDDTGSSGLLELTYLDADNNLLSSEALPTIATNPDSETDALTVTWSVLSQTVPLPPGASMTRWQVVLDGTVWHSPDFQFAVVEPDRVHVRVGSSYRFQPMWSKTLNVIKEGVTETIVVEVLGKRTVSQEGINLTNPRNDAVFLLIRLPNSREFYWLGDQNSEEYELDKDSWKNMLEKLPDV